jgi:pimeloyl-ACP methyl ester carboxylesterase
MTVTASNDSATAAVEGAAIRTFRVDIPEEAMLDLRQRAAATRWPEKETVADASQGAQLAKMQELVRYWGTGYDWRKLEAKLNAFPQFVTEIDGVEIHFIHVRSRHEDALPLLLSHGWPGSVVELLKVIEPLTDPTAHGGDAADAFDLVIPSLPGYGFSGRPTATGWGPDRIGLAWATLMGRLGYDRYVAQGGDWGAVISEAMGRQAPAGLAGIHVNLPAASEALSPDADLNRPSQPRASSQSQPSQSAEGIFPPARLRNGCLLAGSIKDRFVSTRERGFVPRRLLFSSGPVLRWCGG